MVGKDNTKGISSEEELEVEEEEDQDNNSGINDNETDDNESDKGSKKKERNFTQSQVNRMMTREKKQGRTAAFKELGIDPNDTKMTKMVQAFIESQKTDDQKAAERDAETQRKQTEVEQRAIVAEAKAEAMMLGIKSQYVEDAVALAMSKMSDDTDLKTILGELKEKYGLWFEDDEDSSKGSKDNNKGKTGKTGQKGTGASVNEVKNKGNKESSGMGARLAAQRKSAASKSYYWGNR